MSDLTDMIDEAIYDAICNGDGQPRAKDLLVELEHRGLRIIPMSAHTGATMGDELDKELERWRADRLMPLARLRWAKATSSMRQLEQLFQNTVTGDFEWREVPWADE